MNIMDNGRKDRNGVVVEVGDRVHFSTGPDERVLDTFGKVISIHDNADVAWIWIEGNTWEEGKYSKFLSHVVKVLP